MAMMIVDMDEKEEEDGVTAECLYHVENIQ
jgi:hypothetical protein